MVQLYELGLVDREKKKTQSELEMSAKTQQLKILI